MPGNARGAKGPDFWCAFEDGEVRVIGDEPETPDKFRNLQRKLYCLAKTVTCRGVVARHLQ
jgi:RNA-directed DNA polymerase